MVHLRHIPRSLNAPKVYWGTCGGKFAHTPTGQVPPVLGNLGTADGWLQRYQHEMFESQEPVLQ